MGMQENMADMLRAKKQLNGLSIDTWAKLLDIAPSTLQEYLKGEGNPTILMVEHLAEKLGIDPLALISGDLGPEQLQSVLLLLDTIQAVSALPQPKRIQFAEQFLGLVQLLGEEATV